MIKRISILIITIYCLTGPIITINPFNLSDLSTGAFAFERDPALWISSKTVNKRIREKQEILFIDVRSKEEFEKIRIPGSLNIPLYAIRTKTFLKPKPLVLVNDGHNFGQLEKECRKLRDSGFAKTSILAGGLYSWIKNGSYMEGDPFAQKELNKIDPRIFFAERDYAGWIVIDVSKSKEPENKGTIPEAIHIPYKKNDKKFVLNLKTAIARHQDNPFRNVLIVNNNGEHYEEIERIIQKAGIDENIFYLKGGFEGFGSFLRKQALINQQKNTVQKTNKKCGTCP